MRDTTIVLIPARMRATRLPGKPLADIGGQPMIVHVWRRAAAAGIGPVVVACEDATIAEAIIKAGGRAERTGSHHRSGSDRIFEALTRIDPERRFQIVVNLQGDLPAIDPTVVAAVLEPLADPQVSIATLASPLQDDSEVSQSSVVKVRVAGGRAVAFNRDGAGCGAGQGCYHHIGIYAYRRAALERFVALPPSANETRHSLEQLRAMDDGMILGVRIVDTFPLGVDTPADLARAREILAASTRPSP